MYNIKVIYSRFRVFNLNRSSVFHPTELYEILWTELKILTLGYVLLVSLFVCLSLVVLDHLVAEAGKTSQQTPLHISITKLLLLNIFMTGVQDIMCLCLPSPRARPCRHPVLLHLWRGSVGAHAGGPGHTGEAGGDAGPECRSAVSHGRSPNRRRQKRIWRFETRLRSNCFVSES